MYSPALLVELVIQPVLSSISLQRMHRPLNAPEPSSRVPKSMICLEGVTSIVVLCVGAFVTAVACAPPEDSNSRPPLTSASRTSPNMSRHRRRLLVQFEGGVMSSPAALTAPTRNV